MGEGEETECLGTPQGVGVNFLKKKIFSFECAKKVEGGRDTRAHRITPAWARARAESQASNKMRGRENERGVENVRKKARSARANKESPVNSTRDGARVMRELLGEREEDPLTHTTPRTGAKTRGNSTVTVPRGRCSPPPRGAGDGEPLRWAGLRMSSSPKVLSDAGSGWPRLAPRSSPAGTHCIFALPGTRARPAHCPGWFGRDSAGLRGQGASMAGSGDHRYLISSLEAVSSSAPGLSTVCCPPLQRALSGAASGGGRLA